MFNKRGSMHTASPVDLVIILIGIVIGLALAWYGISHGWPVISGFCPTVVAAP